MSTKKTTKKKPDARISLTWEEYRTLPQERARVLLHALAVESKGRMATMADALQVNRKTLIRERAEDAWFATMIDQVKREHRERMANGGYAANVAAKKAASTATKKPRTRKPKPTEETATP